MYSQPAQAQGVMEATALGKKLFLRLLVCVLSIPRWKGDKQTVTWCTVSLLMLLAFFCTRPADTVSRSWPSPSFSLLCSWHTTLRCSDRGCFQLCFCKSWSTAEFPEKKKSLCWAFFTRWELLRDHVSSLIMWSPRNLMLFTTSSPFIWSGGLYGPLSGVQDQVLVWTPPSQMLDLLSVVSRLIVGDESLYSGVVCKFGGVVGGAVMYEEDIEGWTEHTALWYTCVQDEGQDVFCISRHFVVCEWESPWSMDTVRWLVPGCWVCAPVHGIKRGEVNEKQPEICVKMLYGVLLRLHPLLICFLCRQTDGCPDLLGSGQKIRTAISLITFDRYT